jgi:type III secretion system YscQ/HrcQ family protein
VNPIPGDVGSHDDLLELDAQVADAGALGFLPRLQRRQARLDERLARLAPGGELPLRLLGLDDLAGLEPASRRVEVLWRASGLKRPGLVAQLAWPRLGTRLGLGLETPVAHALVDRLLGYERVEAAAHLQLTPVEWGVLTFLIARGLAHLRRHDGPLGPWDLLLDRAGPDPFDPRDLGSIVTLRWGVRVDSVSGSLRLWLPEALVVRWLDSAPPAAPPRAAWTASFAELSTLWRAEAGTIDMPRGLARLRVGGVLPLNQSPLRGTPQSPSGTVALALVPPDGPAGRLWFPCEVVPLSGGGRVTLTAPMQHDPSPREAHPVNPPADSPPAPGAPAGAPGPTDIPVTLTVELGRISLPLARLADLKPGDVLDLGRHSREPVELTSGGRLVARGELVLIDTELGVRVTNVFL